MKQKLDREEGAVAVIYALLFMFLLGFIGLSVDIGAAFAKRQEAQNAADAAAFAVAAQCLEAKVAVACPGDYSAATDIALGNERTDASAVVLSGDIQYDTPAPYHVTVTVTATQPALFLQAIGIDSIPVKRAAVVNFGSPVGGKATLPLLVAECLFPGVEDGVTPDFGTTVELWVPKPGLKQGDAECTGGTYPSGGAGWIHDEDAECSAIVDMTKDVPSQPGQGFPTPECSVDYFVELVKNNAQVLVPLFDLSAYGGSNGEYHVTQFAVLELTGYETQTGGPGPIPGIPECLSSQPTWSSKTCFQGKFIEVVSDPQDIDLGGPIDLTTAIRLVG